MLGGAAGAGGKASCDDAGRVGAVAAPRRRARQFRPSSNVLKWCLTTRYEKVAPSATPPSCVSPRKGIWRFAGCSSLNEYSTYTQPRI